MLQSGATGRRGGGGGGGEEEEDVRTRTILTETFFIFIGSNHADQKNVFLCLAKLGSNEEHGIV
jgi:hypothetical protein